MGPELNQLLNYNPVFFLPGIRDRIRVNTKQISNYVLKYVYQIHKYLTTNLQL